MDRFTPGQRLEIIFQFSQACWESMLVDNKSYPRADPVRTEKRIAAVGQSVRENPRTLIR